MNATKASCGHTVIAVGAPGSPARQAVESQPCPDCYAKPMQIDEIDTVCAWCNRLLSELGEWIYASPRPGCRVSHGICPECLEAIEHGTIGGKRVGRSAAGRWVSIE